MTLEQLRYFVTLGQWEHVGRAARAAGISPSALSTSVSQLEADLGHRLFDRIGRTIQLNARGQELLPKAIRLLSDARSIREGDTSKAKSDFSGRLRVGGSPFLATQILAPIWGSFHKKYPGSTVEIAAPNTADVIARVLRGDLDGALVFSPQSHPQLRIEELFEGPLLPAASVTHPVFLKRSAQDIQSWLEFPLILHQSAPGVDLCIENEELKKHGIFTESSATFSSDDQAIELLTGSAAWSLLPEIVIQTNSKRIRTIEPPTNWRGKYRVCWVFRVNQTPSSGLTYFKDLATLHLEGLQFSFKPKRKPKRRLNS